jgi:hypothetical protein
MQCARGPAQIHVVFTAKASRINDRSPKNSKALPELYETIPSDFNSRNPEVT